MTPAHVRDAGSFKEVSEIHVKDGGVWVEAQEGWVKDAGVWKQFHAVAEPIVTTVEFGVDVWTQTYREPAGQQSGGSNRNALMYCGPDGWNGESEFGTSGIRDEAGVVAALTAKPTVVSSELEFWVGYKRNSTPSSAYVRVYGGSGGTAPSNLYDETIFGTEGDDNTSVEIPLTRPGSTGEASSAIPTVAFMQSFVDHVVAGTGRSILVTSELGGDRNNWGWYMGRRRSRSNSSGVSGSMIDVNTGEVYAPRFIITHQ